MQNKLKNVKLEPEDHFVIKVLSAHTGLSIKHHLQDAIRLLKGKYPELEGKFTDTEGPTLIVD